MTIWDVLSSAGAVAGVVLLLVMAVVPLLLDLPQRPVATPSVDAPATPDVTIPAQRAASPAARSGALHSAA